MSTAAAILAALLSIVALPLILRIDSALRAEDIRRACREAASLVLAAAAVAVLVTIAGRAR